VARLPKRLAAQLLAGGLIAAATFTLLPAAAQADPKVSAAAAQQKLQALADQAEILVEKYDAGQDTLAAASRQLTAEQHAVAAANAQVDAVRSVMGHVAAAAYESGNADTAVVMLTSGDPQSALWRASYLSLLAQDRALQLRTAVAARNKLTQAQQAQAQQLKQVQALQASLAAQKRAIDALVAQQQAMLAASQAQIAADAAAAARVNRSAPRPAVKPAPAARAAAPAPAPPAPPANLGTDGRAAAAVRYAYAQLGKPYRYGGSGPGSFDCSGLTMRAWQAAGVSLPHNAASQYYSTPHVARNALQPGDLVYFGRPIHHVGIYIGNGNMIEAPYTGADVRITNFGYRSDYAGASRP
jgi:cell wall-associated NlpC family hydrolase